MTRHVLTIRIKKHVDGTASLTCTRADGTVTWQRQPVAHAAFFPHHDLTHYAVETVLSHGRGFYGLVAAGRDLSDFGMPWPRGRIPADADVSEAIVGFLDIERASGEIGGADQLNVLLASRSAGHSRAPVPVSEADLQLIRRRRAELFVRWAAVPPGEALELPFEIEARNLYMELPEDQCPGAAFNE